MKNALEKKKSFTTLEQIAHQFWCEEGNPFSSELRGNYYIRGWHKKMLYLGGGKEGGKKYAAHRTYQGNGVRSQHGWKGRRNVGEKEENKNRPKAKNKGLNNGVGKKK